ncbi:MAG: hypothetical protein U0133_00865 [Gemmatimonadales bacterium]
MRHTAFGSAATLLLVLSTARPATAQVAISGGYTWQNLSLGTASVPMRGFSGDVSIRTGRRIDVLFGWEQGTWASADPLAAERSLWTVRSGIHARLLRSEGLDIGVAAGVGVYGAQMDSEDLDGGGFSGFLQARVTLHPLPVVGVHFGATLQTLSGIGASPGGSTTGITLGLQIRGTGW